MAKSLEEHVGDVVAVVLAPRCPLIPANYVMQQKIIEVTSDRERYHRLVESTRDEYERYFNWDVWGKSVRVVMGDVLRRSLPVYAGAATVPSGVAG